MSRKKKNQAKGEHTVIGKGTIINGDITSDAAIIRVDGEVRGGIDTKGDLVVGVGGIVRGNVTAAELVLGGEILGDVVISYKVDIEAKGKLTGDITTHLLAIDENAVIQGKVTMITEEPAAKQAETAPESTEAVAE